MIACGRLSCGHSRPQVQAGRGFTELPQVRGHVRRESCMTEPFGPFHLARETPVHLQYARNARCVLTTFMPPMADAKRPFDFGLSLRIG